MSASKAKQHLNAARDVLLRIAALTEESSKHIRLASTLATNTDPEHWRTIYSEMSELETRASNLMRFLMRDPPETVQRSLPIDTLGDFK